MFVLPSVHINVTPPFVWFTCMAALLCSTVLQKWVSWGFLPCCVDCLHSILLAWAQKLPKSRQRSCLGNTHRCTTTASEMQRSSGHHVQHAPHQGNAMMLPPGTHSTSEQCKHPVVCWKCTNHWMIECKFFSTKSSSPGSIHASVFPSGVLSVVKNTLFSFLTGAFCGQCQAAWCNNSEISAEGLAC